jgi:hypothetical protein
MTNKTLQTNDSKSGRLLVALELSLKAWRLAMAVEGNPKKRFKTIEGGDYVALGQAVEDSQRSPDGASRNPGGSRHGIPVFRYASYRTATVHL